MGFRSFSAFITRFVISLLVFSLLFLSISDLNVRSRLGGLFEDIYEHSSIDAKNDAISNIDEVCNGLDQNKTPIFVQLREICQDKARLAELKRSCEEYGALFMVGQIEEDTALEEDCNLINSPNLEEMCSQVNENIYFNATKLNEVCKNKNSLSNKEYFRDFLVANTRVPKSFDINLKNFIIPIAGMLAFFLVLLYILHKENPHRLIHDIARVLFRIGIMFILIYLAFLIYLYFITPDTSDILRLITGTAKSDNLMDNFSQLIPIIFTKIFDMIYLIVGVIFVFFGFILNYISHKLSSKK